MNTNGMPCSVLSKGSKRRRGGGRDNGKAEDKREVVLADGKPVLRDLAMWMRDQKRHRDKLDPFRVEVELHWRCGMKREHNWKVWFAL